MRVISAITNASQAQVTTTFAHQYVTGMIVRLNVPSGFGMTQVNQQYGPIVVTGNTTFTIDIDTQFYDPFVIAMSYPDSYQSAIVTPIGEISSILVAATQNVLPYSAS
jgi:hypothetical protein